MVDDNAWMLLVRAMPTIDSNSRKEAAFMTQLDDFRRSFRSMAPVICNTTAFPQNLMQTCAPCGSPAAAGSRPDLLSWGR